MMQTTAHRRASDRDCFAPRNFSGLHDTQRDDSLAAADGDAASATAHPPVSAGAVLRDRLYPVGCFPPAELEVGHAALDLGPSVLLRRAHADHLRRAVAAALGRDAPARPLPDAYVLESDRRLAAFPGAWLSGAAHRPPVRRSGPFDAGLRLRLRDGRAADLGGRRADERAGAARSTAGLLVAAAASGAGIVQTHPAE